MTAVISLVSSLSPLRAALSAAPSEAILARCLRDGDIPPTHSLLLLDGGEFAIVPHCANVPREHEVVLRTSLDAFVGDAMDFVDLASLSDVPGFAIAVVNHLCSQLQSDPETLFDSSLDSVSAMKQRDAACVPGLTRLSQMSDVEIQACRAEIIAVVTVIVVRAIEFAEEKRAISTRFADVA